jgi:DNA-binding CsgD family transcriptional regulator
MRSRGLDTGRLLQVSRGLGDAVIDPSIWPEVMEQICASVGAAGAMLLQSDVRTPDVPRTPSFDEALKLYFRRSFHLGDIRAARGVPLLLNGAPVVIDQDLVTVEEMHSDVMYNEMLFPLGFQWFAGVGFRADSALWGLCIQRMAAEGPFESSDKRVLAILSDRLTEVATLSTAVGRIALSSATNALNAVNQAAVAIDRFGFVLEANAATESIFDGELFVKSRRLFAADSLANSSLARLLDSMRITPDTMSLPTEPIFVRRRNKTMVLIRALPVPGAARAPFLGARALLTFSTIEPKLGPQPLLLAKAFGLTPAESRLAALVAKGNSPEQAAEQLGIARVTARNQLRAVFAKTGTHRQSELVALLARL